MLFLAAFNPYPDTEIFGLVNYHEKKISFRHTYLRKLYNLPSVLGQYDSRFLTRKLHDALATCCRGT